LCAAQRGGEISCYQKSVTPVFAVHFAKSTSFGELELKQDRKKVQKRSFLASF
jgi:hypothetical protein